jgi:hypothetical protein
MFLTKKALPRRTFLRGMGVTLALPLLDSMVAAQTPLAKTPAAARTRLGCIYVPHGAVMDLWTPATEGRNFQLTEILSPLEKVKDHLTVVSGLAHPQAAGIGSDAGADHARSAAVFLSGAHPERGATIHGGATLDQVAAARIGMDTPLPSIELSIEDVAANCGSGYGCAYMNTISWRTATMPLPMENNPQVVFEKLFGDGSSAAARKENKAEDGSILDSITREIATLKTSLPVRDRARMDEYLDDLREIERRIQKAAKQSLSDDALPESPVGIPDSFEEHLKLMFDLQVLAYRAEVTRVSTLMFARDLSPTTYPLSGIRDGFHTASHHSNVRANMDKFALINKYHTKMLAYLLEKMKATPDGDGTLLDHSMILYGSSMSNGNQHDHDPLPVLIAGGASAGLKGSAHVRCAPHTHMSNLLLSVLNKLGVQENSFGDSTGTVEI